MRRLETAQKRTPGDDALDGSEASRDLSGPSVESISREVPPCFYLDCGSCMPGFSRVAAFQ